MKFEKVFVFSFKRNCTINTTVTKFFFPEKHLLNNFKHKV